MTFKVIRFLKDDTGAVAIEYAMIAIFIAIAMLAALPSIGTSLASVFQKAADGIGSDP